MKFLKWLWLTWRVFRRSYDRRDWRRCSCNPYIRCTSSTTGCCAQEWARAKAAQPEYDYGEGWLGK